MRTRTIRTISAARGAAVILLVVVALVGLTGCEAIKQASGLVPPGTPAAPTTDTDGTAIIITWLAVDKADGYVLQRSETELSGFADIYTGDQLTYSDVPEVVGASYYYRVAATNANGTSEFSGAVDGAVPAAPPPSF